MVSTPSRKKSKFSYADRVVGALSGVQRQHRKHAVHMATLRAQVRKNADAQHDPLGPQWSAWVSRTVLKLEEQGVLEQPEPGHVAFTVDAKKILVAARRQTIASMPGTPARSAPDLFIAKSLTQPNYSGIKRRRRSSIATRLDQDSDDESEYETPTKKTTRIRRNSSSSKRARRSSVHANTRLTKAELLERIAALEQEEGDAHDIITRLQKELLSARALLGQAQIIQPSIHPEDRNASDRELSSLTDIQDGDDGPSTPSPTRPSASESTRQFRFAMRMESNSIIDQISKQATPARSVCDDDIEARDLHNELRARTEEVTPRTSGGLATPMSILSPAQYRRDLPSGEVGGRDETALEGGALDSCSAALENSVEHSQLSSVHAALKEQIALQETAIATLRLAEQEKATRIVALLAELQTAQDERARLRADVSALEFSLTDKDAILEGVKMDYAAQLSRIATLESTLSHRLAELSRCEEASSKIQAEAVSKSSQHLEAMSKMRSRVELAENEAAGLREDIEARESRLLSQTQAFEDNIATLRDAMVRSDQLSARFAQEHSAALACAESVHHKLTVFRDTIATGQLQSSACHDLDANVEGVVEGAKQRLSLLLAGNGLQHITRLEPMLDRPSLVETMRTIEEELGHALKPVLDLVVRLSGSEKAVASSVLAQSTADGRVRSLTSQLEYSQDSLRKLESSLAEARLNQLDQGNTVLQLTGDLGTARERLRSMEDDLSNVLSTLEALQSAHDDKVTELASLQDQSAAARELEAALRSDLRSLHQEKAHETHEFEARIASLRDSLISVNNELSAARLELQTSEAALRDQESRTGVVLRDLQAAASAAAKAETSCHELRMSQLHDKEQIRRMEEAFRQYSASQRTCLELLHEKVFSARSPSGPVEFDINVSPDP